tara:strand:+ start:132 stop:338 length:207 start_codon:yes stop_codon:yes gene_type:complete
MNKKFILKAFLILCGIFGFILPVIFMENKGAGIALGCGTIFVAFIGFIFVNRKEPEEPEKNNYILYNV